MSANDGMLSDGCTFNNGDRLHGYVVERLLGKGGLGAVYLVRHEVLDSFFALKVLDPKMAAEKPEYVKRFVREAKLASKIRHPNLVAVHDAGFDEGRGVYYLVMDYVQGSTLRQAIAIGGKMEDREAVRIVAHVASALDAAQRFAMVHRDIKPENIMLMQDGTVKLIDLGVAKVAGGMDTLKTMENAVFGTPAYMAPEQATNASAVDARADIYSLGVVFFEMLCGRHPYQGKDADQMVHELLSPDPIPDVRVFNPSVSPKLSAVLSLMCAKRVEDRIPSPAALLETFGRMGYRIPSAVAEYADVKADGSQEMSYRGAPGSANRTLSFDTKDKEIQTFVGGLKRKRFRRRLLWAVCGAAFAAVVILTMVFLAG